MDSTEARLLEASLQHLRDDVARIFSMQQDLSGQLKLLHSMQQSHLNMQDEMQRGSSVMHDHEKRLQTIERDLPGLRELRRWVIGGVIASCGMMGAAILKLVILDKPPTAQISPWVLPKQTVRT